MRPKASRRIATETVERRRWPRAPQVWQRVGLSVRAVVAPQYYRGIRVGWSRVVVLSGPHGEDRIEVGLLGPNGLTALVAAMQRPRSPRVNRWSTA